jgi:hypothetical protein
LGAETGIGHQRWCRRFCSTELTRSMVAQDIELAERLVTRQACARGLHAKLST